MARIGVKISLIIVLFLLMFLVKMELMGMKGAFVHTFWNLGMLILLYNVHGKLLVNTFLESKKYVRFVFGSISLLVLYLIIRLTMINRFLESIISPNSNLDTGNIPFLLGIMAIAVMTLSTLAHLLENRYEKERTNQLLVQEHQAAQLQFLKAQINPHFLFNTLNNIYSLSITQSPKTPQMVLQLSELLRYVIYESQNRKVPLEGELSQIKKYISLFQLKNEHPHNIQFEKEGIIGGQNIEPMILIPLVENALKHCDFDTNEKAYSKIKVVTDGNSINFQTINSKNYHNQQKDEVGGVGLKNIKKRLELNYSNRHELVINNLEHSFEVNLKITVG